MDGKETILKYCDQFDRGTVEHREEAIENKNLIQQERYYELNGCPSSFGLDDFNGLCYEESVEGRDQLKQCERCWKAALGIITP